MAQKECQPATGAAPDLDWAARECGARFRTKTAPGADEPVSRLGSWRWTAAGLCRASHGIGLAADFGVAQTWTGRDKRKAPRIDVLRRVKGHLVELDTPILVHDLSRTGFAVVSELPFEVGQMLSFRLTGEDGAAVTVTAEAMHAHAMPHTHGLHLTGFKFIPGPLTGMIPQARIDQLIETVMHGNLEFFNR